MHRTFAGWGGFGEDTTACTVTRPAEEKGKEHDGGRPVRPNVVMLGIDTADSLGRRGRETGGEVK